jgi:hypothetical protein
VADRIDPSQFVFTAGAPDGTAALPSTAMTMDQIQQSPEGDYADAVELVGHPDHAEAHGGRPDLLHEHPGRFYTQDPGKTQLVGIYRAISPFGGFLSAGHGLIAGFNLHETTGVSPAFVKVHDGADIGAPTMLFISLGPGESTRDWYFPGGLKFRHGLYIEIVTGAIEGVMYSMETEHVQ